ncbi:MAG TPA: hypothetical protein VFH43_11670, partial [Candidatus Kapabacteria bacterium]|nr:hypothetical protein [Candidatus Kapabacteria bacterium]
MKKILLASVIGLGMMSFASGAVAQLRSELPKLEAEREARNTIGAMKSQDEENFFSRLFNKDNWSTQQQYSFSYSSNGEHSMGLSMFTNRLTFKASEDMRISADVSAVYSPFSSFGDAFQKQINGIYLTNARMDWRLGESTFMTIQYSGGPQNQFNDRFYNPWDRFSNPFLNDQPGGTMLSSQAGFGSNGWRST